MAGGVGRERGEVRDGEVRDESHRPSDLRHVSFALIRHYSSNGIRDSRSNERERLTASVGLFL